MNPTIDILRGELERHYSLEDLTNLTTTLLGLDPKTVGGEASKATFARALAESCFQSDRVEALVDVMTFAKKSIDPRVFEAMQGLGKEHLEPGKTIGGFEVKRLLGESEFSFVALAQKDGKPYTLKVLKRAVAADRRAVHRFLTANRLVAAIKGAEGIPEELFAGEDGDLAYVATSHLEGESLAAKVQRTGPQHFAQAHGLFRKIVEAVGALHGAHLVHGDLRLDHVVVGAGGKVTLLDFGGDKLRGSRFGVAKAMAPEVVRGTKSEGTRADVYALGCMLYELLTGKPVFETASVADAVAAHLSRPVEAPSTKAPRGFLSADIDTFVLELLEKDPLARPKDAAAVLEELEALVAGRMAATGQSIPAEKVDALIATLLEAPSDAEAALALENAVTQGGDPTKIADAFADAAEKVDAAEEEGAAHKKSLLYRAGRIYAGRGKNKEKAESVYAAIVSLDGTDDVAANALEEIKKQLGKYDEVVELLLERSATASAGEDRARVMAEVGRIFSHELQDNEQALVAYTQALCENPRASKYADEVEKLAGGNAASWQETLGSITEAVKNQEISSEDRVALLGYAGRFYEQKLGRADMALHAYQQVLATEPSNEHAAEALTAIYRRAQQWPELFSVLNSRADLAGGSPKGRDLRVEAAEVLETKLNDSDKAKGVYQQILAEDPGHARAGEALGRIAEKTGDFETLVAILERRAENLQGTAKVDALVRVAEAYEDSLSNLPEATRRFDAALTLDPKHPQALKGLDRIFNRQGKFHELLGILERQIDAAATPRQKIALFERVAALHDEEFLDHEKASEALEAILAIDPTHDGALTGLARHYRRMDRWEKVISTYERHLEVLGDSPRALDLLVSKARTLGDQVGSPERAMKAYEQVLAREPHHAAALEALAHLREVSGDAHAALSAIEALAGKAETPQAKADQWMRAGRLLEARGDKDGAIERFKMALDANPKDVNASVALRKAYYERNETQAILGLIERELAGAESDLARARLHAELARLYKAAKEDVLAEASAKKAVDLDGTNAEALLVLGDLSFEAGRFLEAVRWYESLVNRPQVLENNAGTAMLVRFVEAFGKSQPKTEVAPPSSVYSMAPQGEPSAPPPAMSSASVPPPAQTHAKLATALKSLREFAPTDLDAFTKIANVLFDHGDPELVYDLYSELFAKHDGKLKGADRVDALYHLGESARRTDRLDDAEKPLKEAADLDPSNARVLRALGKVYDETGKLELAHDARKKRVDAVVPAEKFDALLDLADFEFTRLGDGEGAKKSYARALQERPADRRLLTKLMQLYSEGKDWAKLIDVVEKLAAGVDDKKQRAKYMHTAATLAKKQLNDDARATAFYEKALELDASNTRAADEFVALCMETKQHETAERVLNDQLDLAQENADRERIRRLLDEVGDLYLKFLGEPAMAIDAFEAAQAFDPDDAPRAEKLAELYASNPTEYLDKAVKAQGKLLEANPYRVESYKLLRRLYTEAKQADNAWCLCQALGVLNLAEPEEERFYKKHRAESPAAAQAVLAEEDWARMAHPDADPLVTRVFALIQPTIVLTRSQALSEMGYEDSHLLDTAQSEYPLAQTLYYAAGVLAVSPRIYQNTNDPGALGFLHATEPSVLFGAGGFSVEATTQQLAYLTGRHLAYFRPGFYVQKLVATGTGLKAWLFAAIKLCVPNFPVAVDIQSQVEEAVSALQKTMAPAQKDQLASTVSKILKEGTALDLKRWAAGVDFSADRAGFLLANDLETATDCVRATDSETTVSTKDRLKELVLFGISEGYFGLRKKLVISVDG